MGSPYLARAQQLQDAHWQKQDQAKQDDLKTQLAPLTQASQAAQTRLALYADPNDPTKAVAGKEKEYAATHDQLADIIGKTRMLLHPPPPEDPHGLGYLAARATDKLHITRDLANRVREGQSSKVDDYYQKNNAAAGQQADVMAQGIPPQVPGSLTPDEQHAANRVKGGLDPNADTTYKSEHPTKEPKPAGPLEAGGVAYGVRGADGKEYLASQLTDKGDAPPEAKQIWKTIHDAKAAQQAEKDKAERERDERFLQSQANIANRMGQSEQFQAQMAGYREQLGNYKTIDAQADKTKDLADTYEAQYNDPSITNKSAVDTALLTDYTSILAAGGRKTQAEIALARNIGSFTLNWEQKLKKATTGELPDELRKLYLDYIKAAAKTQREDADKLKPEPPTIGVPEGPKTKQLKGQKKLTVKDLEDALSGK